MEKLVSIQGLSKTYGPVTALNNVNLEINKGEIIGILGPNGSGKTTLIKIITGLLKQYIGDVKIDNQAIGVHSKSIISYLPDCNYLNEKWTCLDAIDFFKDFYLDFDTKRAHELLEFLRIPLKSKIKQLSKGTKEKVQLSLVLSRRAKLYIFDEPIAGVDPASRDLIFEMILKNHDPESTILICTHLIAEAEKIISRAIFLNYGQIHLDKQMKDFKAETTKTLDEHFREVFRCF
ncbi:MAG: ABC transporter ATP-binding protein [Erysipelotrichales bacterium]|nr:ABC transporter ATP-binding protein [Erysipelotrichales bacterium]